VTDPDLGPLTGLRVLEVATMFAAPQVATMLADLGADVVKVEPPAGDPMRAMGQRRGGRSVAWEAVGRNKRSIALDLDADGDDGDDRRTFAALVRAADVLVENLPEPVRTRWGCDFPQLEALNDRLVVVSVSAYGRSGPYADRPGAGTLAEAHAGLTHMTGEADGPPTLASVAIGDTLTAFAGVIGAIAACWSRDARSGPGRHVDVSMYEPVLAIMGSTIAGWDTESAPPGRSGSRVHGGAPRNVYRTLDDRYVAVSGTTDAQVARLLPLLGQDTDDALRRFGRAADRASAADELDGLVAGWIAARDRDDVVAALLDARIPVSPVNDVRDVVTDAQVLARESLVAIGDADPVTVPAPLPRVSGARRAPGPAPALDGDRDAVLADWLA
jgi:crotonobetainyl-CoA:carnitine CoA-transferase CaiB-like acyl-CoA transferase